MMLVLRFGLAMGLFLALSMVFDALRHRFTDTTALPQPSKLRFRIDRHKGKITKLLLGCDAPPRLHFRLRRENGWDRFAKRIGLAREIESGDERFDETLYVIGDDPALLQFLALDGRFRQAALSLFAEPDVREFQCRDGGAWVRLRAPSSAGEDDLQVAAEVAEPLQVHLDALAASLAALNAEEWSDSRDPAVLHHFWINVVTIAIGAFGLLFFWLGADADSVPRPLDWSHVEAAAVVISLASGLCVLGAAWFLLRATSRLHMVLIEVLVTVLPGAWFCGRALLEHQNMSTDRSAPQIAYHEIIAKDMRRHRRSTSYYLVFDYPVQGSGDMRLQVDSLHYQRFDDGDCVRATTRRGALGDPWLESLTGAPQEACLAR